MPVVRRHPDFETDYIARLDAIVDHGEAAWIAILADGVERVAGLLSTFPRAGATVDRRGKFVLRKIVFPRGPYVAWYVGDAENSTADVWLVRLFHARQLRPTPDVRRWVPADRRPRRTARRGRSS